MATGIPVQHPGLTITLALLLLSLLASLTSPAVVAKSSSKKSCISHKHKGVTDDPVWVIAYRGAFNDWSTKVKAHYGASWASTKTTSGTHFVSGCKQVYVHPKSSKLMKWECVVVAKPCQIAPSLFGPSITAPQALPKPPWK